jgi:hypothetical protein
MRRPLLTVAMLVATLGAVATPAAADDLSDMMPGVRTTDDKPSVYMGVVIGHLSSELYNDNHNRGPTENSGWLYGMNFRGEVLNLLTGYGGRFGGTFDFDMFLISGGAISGPQEPRASWVYFGFTPALLLGLVNTRSFSLSAELGLPINTDFYGLSAGGVLQYKSFYLGYRVRSGRAWRDTEVLDERVRIGFGGGGTALTKSFFGLEIIDGYSEDEMGRADLGTLYRGSYTSVSLVISTGK